MGPVFVYTTIWKSNRKGMSNSEFIAVVIVVSTVQNCSSNGSSGSSRTSNKQHEQYLAVAPLGTRTVGTASNNSNSRGKPTEGQV